MGRKSTKPAKHEKPEMFVGSSAEAKLLANSVVQILRHDFKVTPWTAGVFVPSSNALKDLVRQASKTAYSVFVFARDDKVTSRGARYDAARDNVIFELGLFMGKLGAENCFILVPRNRKKLKIPSDLEGFSLVNYEDDRIEENPQAAFAGACADIIGEINRRSKGEAAAPPSTASFLTPPLSTPPPALGLAGHVQDLLGMVHQGAAGLEVLQRDETKFTLWARNALHMTRLTLQNITPHLPADAYVAWLRPRADDRERIRFFLGENTPADFAAAHHPLLSWGGPRRVRVAGWAVWLALVYQASPEVAGAGRLQERELRLRSGRPASRARRSTRVRVGPRVCNKPRTGLRDGDLRGNPGSGGAAWSVVESGGRGCRERER